MPAKTKVEKPLDNFQNNWEDRMEMVKQKVGNTLTKAEWDLFLYMAKFYNLNPLLGEIWAVKFKDKPANIFTGRDGLLKIGHKSGMFDGMKTVLLIDNQKQVQEVDIAPMGTAVLGAKCYVWRKDMSHPIEVSVKMSEYNTHRSTWKEKPDTMIRKVSEAHCLRRAFSIHGLYLPEEFKEEEKVPVPPVEEILQKQPTTEKIESVEAEVVESVEQPENDTNDPKYTELPESVRKTISSNLKSITERYAEKMEMTYIEARKEILATMGVKKIEDLRYTQLRLLYRELNDRLKQAA